MNQSKPPPRVLRPNGSRSELPYAPAPGPYPPGICPL